VCFCLVCVFFASKYFGKKNWRSRKAEALLKREMSEEAMSEKADQEGMEVEMGDDVSSTWSLESRNQRLEIIVDTMLAISMVLLPAVFLAVVPKSCNVRCSGCGPMASLVLISAIIFFAGLFFIPCLYIKETLFVWFSGCLHSHYLSLISERVTPLFDDINATLTLLFKESLLLHERRSTLPYADIVRTFIISRHRKGNTFYHVYVATEDSLLSTSTTDLDYLQIATFYNQFQDAYKLNNFRCRLLVLL